MNTFDAVSKAIGTHGEWKRKLSDAITSGKSNISIAVAKSDRECEFGKWLLALSPTELANPHAKRAIELHKRFHAEAGRTLELAVSGKKPEAEKSMNLGGDYATASSDLTLHMMNWRKSLG